MPPLKRRLIDLPNDFMELLNKAAHYECKSGKSASVKNKSSAICLTCGHMLCVEVSNKSKNILAILGPIKHGLLDLKYGLLNFKLGLFDLEYGLLDLKHGLLDFKLGLFDHKHGLLFF